MSGVDPLIGAWTLVDCTARRGDAVSHPHGAAPVGRIWYGADGGMGVVLGDRDRPGFQGPDPRGGTPEECAAAMRTFAAYIGRWRRDGDEVEHDVELAWSPPWTGVRLRRRVDLDGDTLILTSPPTLVDGEQQVLSLRWTRVG